MPTIARADVSVDLDGKGIPRQAKRIGEEAGTIAGQSASRKWSDEMSSLGNIIAGQMKKNGQLSGVNFSDSLKRSVFSKLSGFSDDLAKVLTGNGTFDDLASGFKDADSAAESFKKQLSDLSQAGAITDGRFRQAADSIEKWRVNTNAASAEAERTRVETEKLAERTKYATATRDKDTDSVNRHTNALGRNGRGMSDNARQVVFWTAAIAAAGGEISVLGSAAGSGLAVLGAGAGALGAGIAVLVAGFKNITGDLADIAPEARGAAEAIQGTATAFHDMQDAIQGALLTGLGPAIQNLASTFLPALQAGLVSVATAANGALAQIAAAWANPTFIATFQSMLEGFAPVFANILTAASTLGQILVQIFAAATPSLQAFSGFLVTILTQFNTWLASDPGQSALMTFFEHGQEIFGALVPLLTAVGQALASLVTPATVAATVSFIQTLTQIIPILGQVLGVLSNLDLFNLLADALLGVLQALQPVMPALSSLATILADALGNAIAGVVPILAQLLQAIVPILPPIVQLASTIISALLPVFEALIPPIMSIVNAFIPLLPLVGQVAGMLGDLLVPIITALTPLIDPLVQIISTGLTAALQILMPIITLVAQLLQALMPIITPLISIIAQLLQIAIIPLQLGMQILTPIIEVLTKIIVALLQPIVSLIAPLLDWVDAQLKAMTQSKEFQGALKTFGDVVTSVFGFINDAIDNTIGFLKSVFGWFSDVIGKIGEFLGINSKAQSSGGGPKTATGAVVSGAQSRIVGEAGPEAIVPLRRNLANVDPAVRGLSALAQGKLSLGGDSGPRKVINVAQGAVQVISNADGRLVGESAIDRLVARMA